MSILITNEKGWTEVIIEDDCGFDRFYESANILKKDFQLDFISKINDFDSLYWGFNYNGSELCLHYNIYMGLRIYPKLYELASPSDNKNSVTIGEFLFEKLKNK